MPSVNGKYQKIDKGLAKQHPITPRPGHSFRIWYSKFMAEPEALGNRHPTTYDNEQIKFEMPATSNVADNPARKLTL
jgi:hypothetical protein